MSTLEHKRKRKWRNPDDLLAIARVNVLGVGVSSLNMDKAIRTLLEARESNQSGYVCVTGVHGVIESQRDPELKQIHNRSLLTVPDGMPTVWMGKEQGFVHMGRVYGPDLMLQLMAATSEGDGLKKEELSVRRNELEPSNLKLEMEPRDSSLKPNHLKLKIYKKYYTHFLYGATEEMLGKLKANLEAQFPGVRIVGTYAPPFRLLNESEEEAVRKIVAKCKPDFFWVGLSTPKQEKFMASHSPVNDRFKNQILSVKGKGLDGDTLKPNHLKPKTPALKREPLECGIMLGVGAAFPIHAGLQKDAPEWVKNSGLQWFYRLCQDPKRLWRRYLDIVPTFLWLAFLQVMGLKRFDEDQLRD